MQDIYMQRRTEKGSSGPLLVAPRHKPHLLLSRAQALRLSPRPVSGATTNCGSPLQTGSSRLGSFGPPCPDPDCRPFQCDMTLHPFPDITSAAVPSKPHRQGKRPAFARRPRSTPPFCGPRRTQILPTAELPGLRSLGLLHDFIEDMRCGVAASKADIHGPTLPSCRCLLQIRVVPSMRHIQVCRTCPMHPEALQSPSDLER